MACEHRVARMHVAHIAHKMCTKELTSPRPDGNLFARAPVIVGGRADPVPNELRDMVDAIGVGQRATPELHRDVDGRRGRRARTLVPREPARVEALLVLGDGLGGVVLFFFIIILLPLVAVVALRLVFRRGGVGSLGLGNFLIAILARRQKQAAARASPEFEGPRRRR